jgi:3-oxoacyl-[acyl-carrier-protein] synthase II
MGGEASGEEAVDENGAVLAEVASRALAQDGGGLPEVVYGMARGAARHDGRETAGLRRLLGDRGVPVTCLNGQLGFAHATSGFYAAAGALLGMRHGEAYATRRAGALADGLNLVQGAARSGRFGRALVVGSSEFGHSTAVVFDSAA